MSKVKGEEKKTGAETPVEHGLELAWPPATDRPAQEIRNINVRVSPRQARGFGRLLAALNAAGTRNRHGDFITNIPDVVRWLADQAAEAYGDAASAAAAASAATVAGPDAAGGR